MSILLGGASHYLERTATVPDYNGNYTVVGVAYCTAADLTNQTFLFGIGTTSGNDYDMLIWAKGGAARLSSEYAVGGAWTSNGDGALSAIAINTWYYWAFQRYDATHVRHYVGTTPGGMALDGTASGNTVASRTAATNLRFGATPYNNTETFLGRLCAGRLYAGRVLTLGEIQAEAAYWPAQDTTSLWEGWRLQTAGTYTGLYNSRDLTIVGGAATTAADPSLTEPGGGGPSAAVGGTGGSGMTEGDIRAGGKTITITLTGTTWIAS